MPKLDLKKQLKAFYGASAKGVRQVDVPAMRYLMIDGRGDPNKTPEYVQAVEALFTVSYITKFMVKRGPLGIDYGVMPLEGLWWADDWSVFTSRNKAAWKWTMMIHQPNLVPDDVIHAAIADAKQRKSLPALPKLRLETFAQGLCAQGSSRFRVGEG